LPGAHDLHDRLGDLAGEAGARARDPGPGAIWLRARARRRRQVGAVALFIVLLTGTVWTFGGRLEELHTAPAAGERSRPIPRSVPTVTTTAPPTTTAGRPPGSTAGSAPAPTLPTGGKPGPLPLQVATGSVGGRAWELHASENQILPDGQANRCLDMRWPVAGSPVGETALRCEATGRLTAGTMQTPVNRLAVVGAAPASTDRLRVELAGRASVTVATVAAGGLAGRFYVAFVPAGAEVTGVVALDGGREVGRTSQLAPTAPMLGPPPVPGPGDAGVVPPPPGLPSAPPPP
jgi:hypothetical protein